MSNLNLKGLWMPIEILTDKNLSDKEKHIYSLIIFLSREKQYCFCTNKTISELLNISVTQVSKLVNSLKNKGYINIEMVYKEKSYLNYSIKLPQYSYEKEFDRIKEKYNLKGQIKIVSNIACEYIITSDYDFFERMGEEETNRKHYSVEEYKKITNFKETKEILKNMKLELPDVPNIEDININRLSRKRDEKILEEIIKPKDNVIQNLYQDNMNLHRQLTKQSQVIQEAEKYQKERDKIMADNRELHNEVSNIKSEYKKKEFDIEWEYKSKIKSLEKENNHLHKVVDKFYDIVEKLIDWICRKFGIGESKELVRDFEKENNTLIDPEKQLKNEEREKERDLEL